MKAFGCARAGVQARVPATQAMLQTRAFEVSLDYLTGLDYSLFIHDKEMTGLLKGYDNLKDEDKSTIKKIIKAFSFYSKVQETQKGMAV
ncbi:MAG: hypothetical protein DRJ01_08530 [Bacteroidetes bacterium]|nr:MAG: hypothetical protein DRJ01_08530 [Bacteroidota bacterium]